MLRKENKSKLKSFFRFSFGPLEPISFEKDIEILGKVINELTQNLKGIKV